jgi:adenine-specific DNA-methyltransferase
MKGFVPTPAGLVDRMVEKLFAGRPPRVGARLLDPGCGTGAFIEGVMRWCRWTGAPIPSIVGVDSDPTKLSEARRSFGGQPEVILLEADFLADSYGPFDYVVGNPPYVSILGLTVEERETYRKRFRTAVGRFDLYVLFFEQALRSLRPGGRLVFVTPEKFMYVESACPLRQALVEAGVAEVEFVDERAFGPLVTYPVVTTIEAGVVPRKTRVVLRSGEVREVELAASGESWLPRLDGVSMEPPRHTLESAFTRISAGVATGADEVFVLEDAVIPRELRRYAYPTIAGRDLGKREPLSTTHSMLVPYSSGGELIPEQDLGPLGAYLGAEEVRARLVARTCAARKPWYAFHETPPLADLLQPKILCKDITPHPRFVIDEDGQIVPRHSVYYLVPADPSQLHDLCNYLNSSEMETFLRANCQRAANGHLRLQSHILRRAPLPDSLAVGDQAAFAKV